MTILQVPPDSPYWIKAGAEALLLTHIGGGTLGMVSGTAAVLARKGETLHRFAGNVFFASMLAMAGVGTMVAPLLHDYVSSIAGFMTLYLVTTGWAAVRRPENKAGRFEKAALVMALIGIALGMTFLQVAQHYPNVMVDSAPSGALYIFMVLGALAAGFDLKVILNGGIAGSPRIARHLWRMCTAFFVATGSFFLGQQKVMPVGWHGSPLLFIPALAPLVFLIFWMIRVRLTRWYQTA